MRLLWTNHEEILGHLYPSPPLPASLQDKKSSGETKTSSHRAFFLTTVAVAPNRFRPVNAAGGTVYEHAQNVLLAKCISLNLDLVSLQGLPDPSAPGVTGPVTDFGRVVKLWLELQGAVNELIDSSAAEKAGSKGRTAIQGIRQGLERKEGLFRKNMMGKRVNFAARSVISPDCCIGTGEIGVPPYFAQRLSFPERVRASPSLSLLPLPALSFHSGSASRQGERSPSTHVLPGTPLSRPPLPPTLMPPALSTAGR